MSNKKIECCPEGSEKCLVTDYEPKGKNFAIKDMEVYEVG